ncbi:Peptidase S41A [Lachnospiraceae bacterium TWA4]|nr:Peptidase S41A [Lachnospiraceae bacterium TWA4]
MDSEIGKRKGFKSGVFTTLVVVFLIGVALVFVARFNNIHLMVYRSTSTQSSEKGIDLDQVVGKLQSINELIGSVFIFDYEVDDTIDGLYKGYLSGLGDKYTDYYNAEEYKQLQESNSGSYKGIGVTISGADGKMMIVEVHEGPAKEAGILADDEIKAVNDKDISNFKTTTEVVKEIRGNDQTTVKLTMYRASTNKTFDCELVLRDLTQETVNYHMEDTKNKVGYLQITQFEEVTAAQFKEGIKALQEQGMKSLILDLRNNPGGLLTSVVEIADELLPEGLILSIEDKNGQTKEYKSDSKYLNIPMTVLVNENSASASEVLSGAIKDHKVGTLVGVKTYGKGIVQNVFPLGDGSAVKTTTAKYYTPSGNYIHGVGINPDIEQTDDSKVLQTALDYLLNESE